MKISKLSLSLIAITPLFTSVTVSAENWAGPNAGLNFSYYSYQNEGHGDSFDDTSAFAQNVWSSTNSKQSDHGNGVGFKAGYNWQTGNYVYGVLADLNYVDSLIESETAGGINDGFYSYKRSDKITWVSTLRGKAGIDVNNFFPYVTAGLALAEVKNLHQTVTCCPTLYESSQSDTTFGYVLGLGVEKKFGENFGINLDASYIDLGKDNGDAKGVVGSATANPSRVQLENVITIFSLGLNYYF